MGMAVQTSYGFGCSKGVAGGLFDLSAHEVASRQAEGKVSFGVGVVTGTNGGVDVCLPGEESKPKDFEGVVVHNSVMTELTMDNKLTIDDRRTVGCLISGKIWVKTGRDAAPDYREQVYLITDGEEAGLFTTGEDDSTKILVDAYFTGVTDDGIAVAVFRYQEFKGE